MFLSEAKDKPEKTEEPWLDAPKIPQQKPAPEPSINFANRNACAEASDENTVFAKNCGDLRGYLRDPSEENWNNIRKLFTKWRKNPAEKNNYKTAVGYAEQHLNADWPDELRVPLPTTSRSAIQVFLKSPVELQKLIRHIPGNTLNQMTVEQATKLVNNEAMANITMLGMEIIAPGPHETESANHDEIAAAIANSKYLSKLTTLILGGNEFGNKGAKQLAKSKHLSNLTTLDLSWNGIGSEGAQALANSRSFPNLTTLDITGNHIEEAGANALANAEREIVNLSTDSNY